MSAIDGEPKPRTAAEAWSGSAEPSRWARLRTSSFGPASEEPYRRRVSDWIRLAVGVVAIGVLIHHHGREGSLETNLLTLINGLPDSLESLFRLVNAAGALWATALVAVAALFARRLRLARDLAVGGALAWVVARVMGEIVGGESFAKSLHVITRVQSATPAFPPARVTIVVAVIAVASPYLTRPVRRLGRTLIVLMAFGPLYLGSAEPDGVVLAIVLGWTIAALVHLAFGSPGGRPTTRQVREALAELGLAVHDIVLAPVQPGNGTLMLTSDDEGALSVRVLGRDEADAQLIGKFWRWLLYKEGGPTLHVTRLEDVEAEAYALLLAERAGVPVPEVVVAGTAGPGAALLVTRRAAAALSLADADPALVTDDVLRELWHDVAELHDAHVAHGRLNPAHVLLRDGGVTLVDFEHASGTKTTAPRLAADVAELLAGTARIVGNERAVRAALGGVGAEHVVTALPLLQTAALSREIRPRSRHERKRFAQLLEQLRAEAAHATGTEVPPLAPLYRVDATNLLMAVGTLVAVAALLSQVGSPRQLWDTVTTADLGWLGIALALSFLTNFATAIALMGTVPINLPLVRTSELQLSMSFSNLAVPALGGMAAQVRFLQKQGVELASAVASGGFLANAGNVAAQFMLLAIALPLSKVHVSFASIDVHQLATLASIVVLAVALVGSVVLGLPRLRHAVVPPTKHALATIWQALRSPRHLALLIGGNMVFGLLSATTMLACINAFGGSIDFWTVLALNIVIGTIASLVPIPGGGTAVSSVGMGGALASVGVPTQIAVAAVLANQLVFNFIPAVPGWFATNDLLRADYL